MNIKPFDSPAYVTKPFLPPIGEYVDGLRGIWDSAWLTNGGPCCGNTNAPWRSSSITGIYA